MKYYIRAYMPRWKEVTKEKADKFIKGVLDNVTTTLTEERRQEIINYHYKEVEEEWKHGIQNNRSKGQALCINTKRLLSNTRPYKARAGNRKAGILAKTRIRIFF